MPSCNYWVFREGRCEWDGASVRAGLASSLRKLDPGDSDSVLDALLRAGELETALADSGRGDAVAAAHITDAVAHVMAGLPAAASRDSLARVAERLHVPETLNISTPEGFSYYALHPKAYAELSDSLALCGDRAAIVGIRSIGGTLSAVVTAALERRGIFARRTTVRPAGHPYDRRTEFTPEQLRWIAAHRSRDAEFLVADEGPGLSGSSFLSVGDALLRAGVERRRIRFLCSHRPNPAALAAPDGGQRWRGFQSQCVSGPTPQLPKEAHVNCSGGEWRHWLYASDQDWPGSWTIMERAKFLSSDEKRLFKFAGYGRFGAAIVERARLLSENGFGPKLLGIDSGFAEYEVIAGHPATASDLSRAFMERIADYCACRATEFRTSRNQSHLAEMARYNFEQITGQKSPEWLELEVSDSAVLCDSRMQPHEWIVRLDGAPIKTDGESHGDDHFFPGPCDIAWDLAGAVVEWRMNADATDALLQRYTIRSGDDVRRRIPPYIVAYAALRSAYCSMAAFAMSGSVEENRLLREAESYKLVTLNTVRNPQPVRTELSSSQTGECHEAVAQ